VEPLRERIEEGEVKFFKKVFQAEEKTAADLIRAAKELEDRIGYLKRDEEETKKKLIALETEALAKGEESKKLLEVRQKAYTYSTQIEAARYAIERVKTELLERLPIEREANLKGLEERIVELRKIQQEHEQDLIESIAGTALLFETVIGTRDASGWLQRPFSEEITTALVAFIDRNKDSFSKALDGARKDMPAAVHGNIRRQIQALEDQRSKIRRLPLKPEIIDQMIEMGAVNWTAEFIVEPIRPHVQSMVY
jgi:predicted RNase H-like nuclease (RuvC/YqgF family)